MPKKVYLPFSFNEVSDPGSRAFSINDKTSELAGFVVRKGQDLFGYQNQCPHTGVTLNWTEDVFLDADDSQIQCAMHGALFTIEEGRCTWGPCLGESLEKLELQIDSRGKIFIEIVSNRP